MILQKGGRDWRCLSCGLGVTSLEKCDTFMDSGATQPLSDVGNDRKFPFCLGSEVFQILGWKREESTPGSPDLVISGRSLHA